ncbi:phosphoribosyltransferase family protein [Persicobacter psychrovividus]|uniref:Bifunctional protein PyrR n=1 Tax=Persicobacter psychrovividus TaxID=387638 RepID=A0ABN6L3U8_9BACT|nr:bifunctional protein PyrR [Persicobacter psychrovividus]
MATAKNKILDRQQVLQKIKRIAFEIYEQNYLEEAIYLAGIPQDGYAFAEMLRAELKNITDIPVELIKINVDKKNLMKEITLDKAADSLTDKTIIIVDDVMNTGKTFFYALQPFMTVPLKKLQTAVLVNRSHTVYPVAVNFSGYELSTVLSEHIEVDLTKDKESVYLF